METEPVIEQVVTFHDSMHCPTCIAEEAEDEEAHDEDSLDGACLCHDSFGCPDEYNGAYDYRVEDY